MKPLKRAGILVIALTASVLTIATTINAQTPDGETPANEGVCDSLVGGTPGLYGLCVAYCEAQDHIEAAPGDPPSTKILDAYNKRRKSGDPEMPCIQEPCPCWSEEDLDVALPTLTQCDEFTGDSDPTRDGAQISGPSPAQLNSARLFVLNTNPNQDQCLFVVQQQGLPNSGIFRELFITKDEGAICEASIRQHADSLGVPCDIP